MRVLVLGGTGHLGNAAIVRALLERQFQMDQRPIARILLLEVALPLAMARDHPRDLMEGRHPTWNR